MIMNLIFKSKEKKISQANKEYYKKHGNKRRVPVKQGNKVVGSIYLNKRKPGQRFIGEAYA